MLTLYGINNCDTIKKTRKLLEAEGLDYQFHDYKKLGCPETLIEVFLKHFSYKELINTRGTTWRKLDSASKETLNEKSAATLMSENPSMIKRPLIDSGKNWLIGFDEEAIKSLKP